MRYDDQDRRSSNVEDRRSQGGDGVSVCPAVLECPGVAEVSGFPLAGAVVSH